jgi:cytochrome c553
MIFNRAIATLALLMAANVALAGGVMKGDAAAGEALVGSCAACHGADGNSLAPTFPKLAGLGERYLLKQMKDIRDGRRPVALMAGQVDNMTDQQLADIAAFYDAQDRTAGTTDPDLVKLGRKVYLAGIAERKVAACSGCHSPSGKVMALVAILRWQVSTPTTLHNSLRCSVLATRMRVAERMVVTARLCALLHLV